MSRAELDSVTVHAVDLAYGIGAKSEIWGETT